MTVWSQPWLHSSTLTDFHCGELSAIDKKPDIVVGGHKPVDVSVYHVKDAVDFVIKYLNTQSDDLYSLDLFQVLNGTQQVRLWLSLVHSVGSKRKYCLYGLKVTARPFN